MLLVHKLVAAITFICGRTLISCNKNFICKIAEMVTSRFNRLTVAKSLSRRTVATTVPISTLSHGQTLIRNFSGSWTPATIPITSSPESALIWILTAQVRAKATEKMSNSVFLSVALALYVQATGKIFGDFEFWWHRENNRKRTAKIS